MREGREKVRLCVRVTPEFRREWRKNLAEMNVDRSQEAMTLLVDLYRVVSEMYKEKDLRRLVHKVKNAPFTLL